MTIRITGSYRDKMTWRNFPNKDENDRFYDEHLLFCRTHGSIQAKRNIEETLKYYESADAVRVLTKEMLDVCNKELYTWEHLKSARSTILGYTFRERLRVSDEKFLNNNDDGTYPKDLWEAYWNGWKKGMLLGLVEVQKV